MKTVPMLKTKKYCLGLVTVQRGHKTIVVMVANKEVYAKIHYITWVLGKRIERKRVDDLSH